jgi:hypothetical protein
MKTLLLIIFATLTITISDVSSTFTKELTKSYLQSINDNDGYTYVYVEIEGKMYVYVYLNEVLVEVYEME